MTEIGELWAEFDIFPGKTQMVVFSTRKIILQPESLQM